MPQESRGARGKDEKRCSGGLRDNLKNNVFLKRHAGERERRSKRSDDLHRPRSKKVIKQLDKGGGVSLLCFNWPFVFFFSFYRLLSKKCPATQRSLYFHTCSLSHFSTFSSLHQLLINLLSTHSSIGIAHTLMRTSLIQLATAGSLLALASAQTPALLCCMAYTTVDGTTLYIQGGAARGSNYNNQFYSLDLTTSGWNTSSPPWKVLPVGAGIYSAPFTYYHAMTPTRDNKELIVWSAFTGFSTYDFATSVWTNNTLRHPNSEIRGGQASLALDPTTGLIYVPGGVNKGTGMLIYDPVAANTTVVPMYPSTVLPFLNTGESFVWSELRKSFLYFGGFNQVENSTVYNQYMIEYQPSTYSWTRTVRVS